MLGLPTFEVHNDAVAQHFRDGKGRCVVRGVVPSRRRWSPRYLEEREYVTWLCVRVSPIRRVVRLVNPLVDRAAEP